MASIRGKIAVDIEFADSTAASRVRSMKTIALRSADEYTTGKVAVVTGTAGTAAVTLGEIGETPYRDSTGALVGFNNVSRVAFRWSGTIGRTCEFCTFDGGAVSLASSGGKVAVSETDTSSVAPVLRSNGIGNTGTYTIVIYGT